MEFCGISGPLHPWSQSVLSWHAEIGLQEFLRLFSLPNSDYIAVAQCLSIWLYNMQF